MAQSPHENEIALSDSLELFGEKAISDSNVIEYGNLVLSIPPKEGKANTLLADQLFSPSLLLAELIERRILSFPNQSLLELGAGCALPSLLASTLPNGPSLVVVTDYPAPVILSNLHTNVARNKHLFQPTTRVLALGHEWGADPSPLLTEAGAGFDTVILSDLLHFSSSHTALVDSLIALLARRPSSRVYAAAGKYTPWTVCQSFLSESSARGIVWSPERSAQDVTHNTWHGTCAVQGLSREDLGARKANCWWWVGRWGV